MPLRGLCASAHRRSGYSLSGCVPAEPDSASPDIIILRNPTEFIIPPVDTFRGSYAEFWSDVTEDVSGALPQTPRILGGVTRRPKAGMKCMPRERRCRSEARASSAHRRSGYSLADCVPAEPDSASPDTIILRNPTEFTARQLTRSEVAIRRSERHNAIESKSLVRSRPAARIGREKSDSSASTTAQRSQRSSLLIRGLMVRARHPSHRDLLR